MDDSLPKIYDRPQMTELTIKNNAVQVTGDCEDIKLQC